jgi:hypothetical protein
VENTFLYKKLGRLQKAYETNNEIYSIDISSDFYLPEINIYVIER